MKTKIFLISLLAVAGLAFMLREQRVITGKVTAVADGSTLPGVKVLLKGTRTGTFTDAGGNYSITVPDAGGTLVFSFAGMKTQEVKIGNSLRIDVALESDRVSVSETVVTGNKQHTMDMPAVNAPVYDQAFTYAYNEAEYYPYWNTEEYDGINENIFHDALRNPLSTFSIDVDAASYSNVRRFINYGQKPPKDAVRIEELVNYFDYDYPQPADEHPFSITTEIAEAPWNRSHKLVHIGLQGRRLPTESLPPANLVFLIDVSGSMNEPNRLPLVKASLHLLINELRAADHVAMVVYAGAAGLVLDPTPGTQKEKIRQALDRLEAGGSTAGGAGLRLAYATARKYFNPKGNNRVILCTDGDFNVGESSNAAMERLIEEERSSGVYLTILGFGMGNYKDSKMEVLSNKGNGNYAYIDNISEARKVLVNEFGGTLFTIAKDVKLQIEFNPAKVKAYRLIGYENRLLRNEDFNNDKKDAGDLGSGHTVTALYEIIPVGVTSGFFQPVDELKYQKLKVENSAMKSDELMTVKFRYKKPEQETSKLIVHVLTDGKVPLNETSNNFRWSAAVAAFGMLLRESEYIKQFTFEDVVALAQGAQGIDEEGYRREFITMAKNLSGIMARK
ncbi:MAG: von Willebrand factor type A domain-containing protein [Cyclobacteriaceae bacterium]|nr:von Willebrand factor type A domain-containing protein [Cyclobacteriaceae bacterium]